MTLNGHYYSSFQNTCTFRNPSLMFEFLGHRVRSLYDSTAFLFFFSSDFYLVNFQLYSSLLDRAGTDITLISYTLRIVRSEKLMEYSDGVSRGDSSCSNRWLHVSCSQSIHYAINSARPRSEASEAAPAAEISTAWCNIFHASHGRTTSRTNYLTALYYASHLTRFNACNNHEMQCMHVPSPWGAEARSVGRSVGRFSGWLTVADKRPRNCNKTLSRASSSTASQPHSRQCDFGFNF